MVKASNKIPGGKTVHLELKLENGVVEEASLRGDFFLEPPEKLEDLEEKLEGLSEDAERSEIVEKLEKVSAELIGFSREDVAETFEKAVRGEER